MSGHNSKLLSPLSEIPFTIYNKVLYQMAKSGLTSESMVEMGKIVQWDYKEVHLSFHLTWSFILPCLSQIPRQKTELQKLFYIQVHFILFTKAHMHYIYFDQETQLEFLKIRFQIESRKEDLTVSPISVTTKRYVEEKNPK